MSDKPRRPWFQIHLSTAIVLMFGAGALLWLNMRTRYESPDRAVKNELYRLLWASHEERLASVSDFRGWPWTSYAEIEIQRRDEVIIGKTAYWDYFHFSYNIAFAAMFLVLIGISCERLIRRREARAP
jgi:hypothetical protein